MVSYYDLAALAVSLLALLVSIIVYLKSVEFQSYEDLDTLYMEVLKVGVDHPEFRNLERTHNYKEAFKAKGGEEVLSYESYAYFVWNICETIYDRCHKNQNEIRTWYPVIHAERQLHSKWLTDNPDKFKEEFIRYMAKEFQDDFKDAKNGRSFWIRSLKRFRRKFEKRQRV